MPEFNLGYTIDNCSGGNEVSTDRNLDITFRLQAVEGSSLVSVLFREEFSHPYISFFHLQLYLTSMYVARFKWILITCSLSGWDLSNPGTGKLYLIIYGCVRSVKKLYNTKISIYFLI